MIFVSLPTFSRCMEVISFLAYLAALLRASAFVFIPAQLRAIFFFFVFTISLFVPFRLREAPFWEASVGACRCSWTRASADRTQTQARPLYIWWCETVPSNESMASLGPRSWQRGSRLMGLTHSWIVAILWYVTVQSLQNLADVPRLQRVLWLNVWVAHSFQFSVSDMWCHSCNP